MLFKSLSIQAVIHEVQRVANTVPLSVPHCTTKDTELMGYSIPRVRSTWCLIVFSTVTVK